MTNRLAASEKSLNSYWQVLLKSPHKSFVISTYSFNQITLQLLTSFNAACDKSPFSSWHIHIELLTNPYWPYEKQNQIIDKLPFISRQVHIPLMSNILLVSQHSYFISEIDGFSLQFIYHISIPIVIIWLYRESN